MATIVNISHLSKITWSHLSIIVRGVKSSAERDFYLAATARDNWTVQQLRQEITNTKQLEYRAEMKSQILQFPKQGPTKRSSKSREEK